MKFEIFSLKDLSIKGEGNLHIIILNERTGHVFRFQKETSNRTETSLSNGDSNINHELNIHKMYKIAVNFKKYNVIQKFWGKVFLPKTEYQERAGLMPSKMIEEIASYVEDQRAECRKHRSIIIKTCHIEIQPDLTIFPLEYKPLIDGKTFCVELKPKFGILFERQDSENKMFRNKCARFCLGQKMRDPVDRTGYCPCDFFSGEPTRMTRAIKELIINSQDKLRLFEDGEIIRIVNEDTINNLMTQLVQSQDNNNDNLIDRFCQLVIQAVTFDKSGTNELLKLPFPVSTNCGAHPWSTSNERDSSPLHVYNGSVLGRLIHTDCLVDNSIEEIKSAHEQLNIFLDEHNIEKRDNIFDLWNEHLISLELPDHIRDIVRLLKRYVVCLTIRDCSLMIKFCHTSRDRVMTLNTTEDNSMVLEQPDKSLVLVSIEIIDISIKPLTKINYNAQLELLLADNNNTALDK